MGGLRTRRMLLACAIAALLASAGPAGAAPAPHAASRGCPQAALKRQPAPRNIAHPPARAVLACVGTTPITGALWAHWYAIARRAYKGFGSSVLTIGTLATLTSRPVVEGEAREHHLVVTARAVRRQFQRNLRTRFRRRGSFQRFLRARGERTADYLAEVRTTLLVAAIERHETHAELDAIGVKWQQRTTCARAVSNGDICGLIAPFAASPPSLGIAPGPESIAVDPVSDTVYVGSNTSLTLIDGTACNASDTSGCGHPRVVAAPHIDPVAIAVDPATRTLYVGSAGSDEIAVLDARTCNAKVASCKAVGVVKLKRKVSPQQFVLDPVTHTLYALEDNVSVIDVSHCNALDRSGCRKTPARMRIDSPEKLGLNPATGTLYVGSEFDSVSLVDTRSCGALNTSRCAAAAPTFELPGIASPAFAVDPATNTVFLAGYPSKLFMLDGATCSATVRSGCAHPRTVRLRGRGEGIAIDGPTHTIYLATPSLGGAELLDAGTLRTPHLARTGRGSREVAIDERTRTVYVGNDDSVSLIRADRCNASTTAGC
jgi:DNA-binding beta-propeller fold protein YncE